MKTSASALPAFLRSFDLPEPGELRRVARVYVWGRWFVLSIAAFAWLYPLNVDEVVYGPNVALAILLFATNGYLHFRLATERTVSWRWMLALSALDLAMLSGGVAAHRGFESPFFVGYYPSLAMFAVVFGSVRLTLVWVTMAAAVYAALCLAVEPGLDFSANDEEILLIRVAGMYTVVVVVNLISRVERIRRMEAVERERALQRERIELSHAIHNTMAQSAYLIGMGIERAKELADRSNEELMSTLDETSALSRSAMWEMRHPMEIGEIFEGMELSGVLESLAATFSTISSIPADLVQSGVEPPLPIATRGRAVLHRLQRPDQRPPPLPCESRTRRPGLRAGRAADVDFRRWDRSPRRLRDARPGLQEHEGGRRASGRQARRGDERVRVEDHCDLRASPTGT